MNAASAPVDRYVVIVVDRTTGRPKRLTEVFEGEEGADRAHRRVAAETTTGQAAFVVGLR